MRTLHDLPRFADRWSFLYLEMGRLDQDASGLIFENAQGQVPVPIDQLSLVMLGPGTTVTHAAAKALSQNACLLAWTGQDAVRLYAHSTGATHSARRLIRQAALVTDLKQREEVARRMYLFRFAAKPPENSTLEQLRGMEGHRVRTAYSQYAARYAVPWSGRSYDPGNWDYSDPINRAISTANACLNGVCHAAIVAAGYSPGLGFIHTGKMLSFVYDIADLYKVDLTVRIAFEVVARGANPLERAVRTACREAFAEFRLMDRLLPDIQEVLGASDDLGESADDPEGRVISLADRAQEWGFPRESDEPGEGEAMGEGASEM